MLHRRALAAAIVLAASAAMTPRAHAEDPQPAPPAESVDDSPTPFACSVETLLSGKKCTLDFAAPKAEDRAATSARNVENAGALGAYLCPRVSRLRDEESSDGLLQKQCEMSFKTAAAASCTLNGGHPLLDHEGHFAEGSSGCYQALGRVLSRTRSMAALTVRCCRCAAQVCKLTEAQCNDRMVRGAASDATAQCAREKCADACALTPNLVKTPDLTPPEERTPLEEVPPWQRPGSGWPWY